jgi:hypothetical protein
MNPAVGPSEIRINEEAFERVDIWISRYRGGTGEWFESLLSYKGRAIWANAVSG